MDSRKSVAGRAAIGLGLLVGFYALVAAVIAGAVALNVVVAGMLGRPQLYLVMGGGLVVLALLRSVVSLERTQHADEEGIAVSREDEPRLWALVDETAAAVGTRPPDELVLVDDVNAGVMELGGLLGLRRGRRRLEIGLGLLNVLDVRQARAVLAHEMGHYSGGDTVLGPVNYRGGASIGRAVSALGSTTLLGRLFTAYAWLYWRITLAVRRRQELSADATAIAVAGCGPFAASLRSVAVAGPAYSFFLSRYAAPVWEHGAHPADLYAGFRALLGDPRRAEQLEGILAEAQEAAGGAYDSHPPLAERLAAVADLPGPDAAEEPPAPSSRTLLRDPAATERAMSRLLAGRALGGEAGPAHEWDDVATAVHGADLAARAHEALATLGRLQGIGAPSLRHFLDALGSEAVLPLAVALTGDVSGVPAEQRTDLQAAVMKDRTSAVVGSALVAQGRATWRLSWAGPLEIVTRDGAVLELDALVDRALDDDALPALRERLYELGVDERWRPAPPAKAPVREELLGVVNDLHRLGRRCDLLVFSDRLVVVSFRLSPADALVVGMAAAMGGSGRADGPFRRRCAEYLRTPVDQLVARDPRNRAVRWAEVADARLTRRPGGWRLRLVLVDGEVVDCKSLSAAPRRKAVEALLHERLAAGPRAEAAPQPA